MLLLPYQSAFYLYFLLTIFNLPCSSYKMSRNILDVHPCGACRKIADKFAEGLEKTAGSNFGGGNTDWEEKKLKGYAQSETRFIEIVENVCSTSDAGCNSFLEENEDLLEDWYQTNSAESIDNLYQWLCIENAEVCCPEGTFGENCERCPYGDNELICSGNGKCDGDGIRFGTGNCTCNEKYNGTTCSDCQSGYLKSIDETNNVICSDIDECRSNIFISPCHLFKCNNTEGSYECYGEPFYHDVPKMSTLGVLLLTASIFMYKEIYGLASLTLITTSALLILFVKNIL